MLRLCWISAWRCTLVERCGLSCAGSAMPSVVASNMYVSIWLLRSSGGRGRSAAEITSLAVV
eukprot:7233584-Pyramimonas_sp.AAC.1